MNERGIVSGARKIAVLRANAIGDFVFSLPAQDALRAAYPDAEIVYLGKPWHAEFLPGRAPVDRVIAVPPSQGVNDTQPYAPSEEIERFLDAMRSEEFDIVVQLHGGGRYSNPFARRLGGRVTVGSRAGNAEPLDRWVPYIYYHNEYLRYLEVVSLVGARPVVLDPRLRVLPGDREGGRALAPDSPFAVLNPGASDPMRRWPAERFAAVGDWLSERGFRIVITGNEGDQPAADAILATMRHPGESFCGRTSLPELAGVLSLAGVVVSNDSGPLHLAQAVGAPTIGLYWCGNLINGAPPTRTLHRQLASWMTHCPLCGQDLSTDILPEQRVDSCDHQVSMVAAITVEQVTQVADWLLSDLDLLARARSPVGANFGE